MHDVGVVFPGENISRSSHVSGELVDFVKSAVDSLAAGGEISEIADDEIISLCFAKPGKLQVGPAHPEALSFQPLDKRATDESPRATDQCTLHPSHLF